MMNKQPEEQPVRRYRYRATSSVSRPLVRRGEASQQKAAQETRKAEEEQKAVATATRRKVTMPHEAIQPLSWAERNERRYRPQPARPEKPPLVQRTLSQTGRPAPVGQMRASRPLPRRGAGSPVPARKRRQRGRGFWGKVLSFLTVLIVLVGGTIFALTSPTFHVQQLAISGTQNPGLIATIQHMGIQGQNIFLLNQSALTARLDALPLVASASMAVQLPHSVQVNIQERVPVLLWQNEQRTFGVAQDGTVIAPVSELDNVNSLNRVEDQRSDVQVRPGTHFSAEDILFAQQLYKQLPGIQEIAPFTLEYMDHIAVDGRIVPANVGGSGSYAVASKNGWVAYLGDETNSNPLTNRLLELQQILSLASQQHLNLATIDLRFGQRPTYTLKP